MNENQFVRIFVLLALNIIIFDVAAMVSLQNWHGQPTCEEWFFYWSI